MEIKKLKNCKFCRDSLLKNCKFCRDSLLKHKNYYGSIEFSVDDNIFYGKVIGLEDLVSYEAESLDDLKIAFFEAVEDYLKA